MHIYLFIFSFFFLYQFWALHEGMQPGCLMKILEAKRWLKDTNSREVALLQQQQDEGNTGAPHPGLGRWKGAMHVESAETCPPPRGLTPI
jgi:hypothetical protein